MKVLVLSKFPLAKRYHDLLGLPADTEAVYAGVSGTDEVSTKRADLKEYRAYFLEDLGIAVKPDAILALGNEALYVTTGHSGIMKYRGQPLECLGIPVVASISPSAVERTPSMGALLRADVAALVRRLEGTEVPGTVPDEILYVNYGECNAHLGNLLTALDSAAAVAFDLETSGFDEYEPGAFVVSISLTLDDGSCWAVPLCHPDSPQGDSWIARLQTIAHRISKVPIRIGHNAKFDCRWLAHFGSPVSCNFDTMLAAHVLDENRTKKLKDLASMLLSAPPWDIHIDDRKGAPPWYLQHSLQEILEYNALDTWHTMRLYRLFEVGLRGDPKSDGVFRYLMMPTSQSLVHIERAGTYVDRPRAEAALRKADDLIQGIEDNLLYYIPEDCPHKVNWNPSNFLRWLLFEHLGLPVLKRTKSGPSCDEETFTALAEQGHEIVKLLLERTKWYKMRSTYFRPWLELMTEDSRLRTTFKLHGTVTGRLASGKADDDKITGSNGKIRGVNLQNVPRAKIARTIFSAPPGWKRVDADYSQLELRIAADLAQERHMMSLYSQGADIHTTMAMTMTGKPREAITYEERTCAKAVNFGFLYGMGAEKFVSQSKKDYGVEVTLEEAEAFRAAFFATYPGLRPWHAQQRRLAHKYKRVQTPLGRTRHLPDIDSPAPSVQSEAERQAINAPVQGMGSDLCILSMSLLHRKFLKAGMRSVIVGNVHDAICFEIPDEELSEALPMIKYTMENPPLKKLFDYELSVPLVADLSVGTHWGEQEEIKL